MSQGFHGNSGRNRYQKSQKFQQRSQYPSNYYDNYYDDSTYYQKTDYQNKKYGDYNNNNKNKNRPRNNVNSQLIKAVKDNDIPSVKECIRNGANVDSVDFKDYEKRNALTWAVIGGNLEIIELLLQNGAQWSHCSHGMKTGRTAMHFGVRFNKIESINKMYQLLSNEERLLLIEYPTLKYQWTPLHLACYYKQYESCLWLLEHGANVFCATENGELPIDFAKKQTYNRKTNEVFKVSKKLIKLIEKYQNKVINNGDTTNSNSNNNNNNNNGECGECGEIGEIGESNVIMDGLDGNDPGSNNNINNNNNNNKNNSNPNAKKKMEFENKDEEKEKELLSGQNNINNNNNNNNNDTPGGLLIGCNDNENENDNNNDNSDNSSSFHNNNDNIINNNNTMMGFEDGNNNNDVLNEGSLLNEKNGKNENNVMNDRTRHYYIDDINILRQIIDQMWKSNDQLQQRIDFLKAKNQHVQDNVSNNKLYKE